MKQSFDSLDEEWRSPIADETARNWLNGGSGAYATCASASLAFKIKASLQADLLRPNWDDSWKVIVPCSRWMGKG